MKKRHKILKRMRRKKRVRKKIRGSELIPRLCVTRTLKHIYAQVVIDPPGDTSRTIFTVSSLSKDIRDSRDKKSRKEIAKMVGLLLAKKAKERKIKKVVFDRSGYRYHGIIKALAEGAREGGLEF